MKNMKSFYSKPFLLISRCLAVIFTLLIILYITVLCYKMIARNTTQHLFSAICFLLTSGFLITIIKYPERFDLFVPPLLFFCIYNCFFDVGIEYPIMEFSISVALLWIRGFFSKNKTLKIILLSVFFAGIPLSKLFFGLQIFLLQLFDAFQFSLLVSALIFFIYLHMKNKPVKDAVLNVAEYEGTSSRDAEWLKLIQQGVKYEAIAIDYELTLGTVQNRLNKLYHIMETGDRIGFLSMYSTAKIIYK